MLTTYAIASGTNKDDKRFFKKMGFQVRANLPRKASSDQKLIVFLL